MAWDENLEPGTKAYEIAASRNQYLRVIAGPGTGKSFAMKRRVARLLEQDVEPGRLLPVTFTRVAAEDLHRELVGMEIPRCDEIKGTTLHSFALKVLIREHVLAQTRRTPRPLNQFELKPLEKDLALCHGGVRKVRKQIKAYEAAWARLQRDLPGSPQSSQDVKFEKDLISWLIFHQGMLIGEVIPYLYKYLNNNPDAPELNEYSYILVDEYQDLNRAEQGVISLLGDKSSICIVGDDDQSIYSFKYAHPQGIQQWTQKYQDADDLTICDCRRCPTTIVDMANCLIRNNENRSAERMLESMPGNGRGDVQIVQYTSLDYEVLGVSQKIVELIGSGTSEGDILVLAQRKVIGTQIYKRLLQLNIPAFSYYAESELDKSSAQEHFAYLKLLASQEDRIALRWLLGMKSKKWLANSYRRLKNHCTENSLSPWDALSQISAGSTNLPYTYDLVKRFIEIQGKLSRLRTILKKCGISNVVDDLFPSENEDIKEIRNIATSILAIKENIDLDSFVREIEIAIAKPEVTSEIKDVRVMSLHKSKGLSAPVTIIAGCVEGLLPSSPETGVSLDEQDAFLEEQRRLFFVGITRVKAVPQEAKPGTLILTYSLFMPLELAKGAGIKPVRTLNNKTVQLQASRFIRELGPSAPHTTIM